MCLHFLAQFGSTFYILYMKILTLFVVVAIGVAFYLAGQNQDVSPYESSETKSADSRPAANGPTSQPVKEPAAVKEEAAYDYGAPKKAAEWKTPKLVKVQHILLSFTGAAGESRLSKRRARTIGEARDLAHDLVKRIRGGEDMGPLVRAHTQDSAPGIYEMSLGAPPRAGVIAKNGMVPNFGDVSFKLDVGEVGLAEYDAARSPYGFHIVKRIQ
ncbi:MAG: parvulin-like peptidyl-prolyl isomerase [Planctomycetota bacterium]|jgi:parvulin-like peptidyl-prolyl isomerase